MEVFGYLLYVFRINLTHSILPVAYSILSNMQGACELFLRKSVFFSQFFKSHIIHHFY